MEMTGPGNLRTSRLSRGAVALVAVFFAGVAGPVSGATDPGSDETRPVEIRSRRGAVSCGDAAAAKAGARILEEGGNAVDAAVATSLAMGVVDPSTSGLGGAAFVLIAMRNGAVVALDGSVTAPIRVDRAELARMKRDGYVPGYRKIAAPGALAALGTALERYGTMPFPVVARPAIEMARDGVERTPVFRAFAESYASRIVESKELSFELLGPGTSLRGDLSPACPSLLERTLRRLAANGWRDFYVGEIASEIDAEMTSRGGAVRRMDLARVRAEELEPVHARYRGHEVLAAPYPAAGATLALALNVLDRVPREVLLSEPADRRHLLVDAVRMAWAEWHQAGRSREASQLAAVDPGRADKMAALVRLDRLLADNEITEEPALQRIAGGTTQISVIDAAGNAVSLTQSLGGGFGACVSSPTLGFPWNELLLAFDMDEPRSVDALAPGKKAFLAAAPAIVRGADGWLLALGSPGTTRIPSILLEVITRVVDQGLPLAQAVGAPRVLWGCCGEGDAVFLETAPPYGPPAAAELTRRLFWDVRPFASPRTAGDLLFFGGVNAVLALPNGTTVAVADARRQGAVAAPGVP